MSFNLFIFERRENIKTSIDINNYIEEFTKYEEEDYNSLEGCSETIVKFAKKMFEKFPPVEIISIPLLTKNFVKSSIPVLSYTEIKALFFIIYFPFIFIL